MGCFGLPVMHDRQAIYATYSKMDSGRRWTLSLHLWTQRILTLKKHPLQGRVLCVLLLRLLWSG